MWSGKRSLKNLNYNNNLFGVHKANIGLVSIRFTYHYQLCTGLNSVVKKLNVLYLIEVKVNYIFDSKA